MFVYGFDDLTRDQTRADRRARRAPAEVTVAVTYADRRGARAPAPGSLSRARRRARRRRVGAASVRLRPTPRAPPCATSTATCSSPSAAPIEADDGLVLLDSAGRARRGRGDRDRDRAPARRRATSPTRSRSSLRHPDSPGPLLGERARRARDPGRARGLDAGRGDLRRHLAGRALPRGRATRRAVEALLAHLRTDPSLDPGVDRLGRAPDPPRRARRRVERRDRGLGEPAAPPRSACARRPDAARGCGRWRASARELAEGAAPRRGAARARLGRRGRRTPVLGARAARGRRRGRAARRARRRSASCPAREPPDLADAIEALESATVPLWRGPAAGRVRIMSPYRARAARVRGAVLRRPAGGRVPERGAARPAARRRSAARELGNPRPAPRRPGRRGALPVPRLRLAPDRAPLPDPGRAATRTARRGRARRSSTRSSTWSLPTPATGGAAAARARARAGRDRRRRGDHAARCSRARWPATGWRPTAPATLDAARRRRRRGRANAGRVRRPARPGRPPGAAALARGARRSSRAQRTFSANSLEGGSRAPTAGSSTTSSSRSGSTRRPTRCGSAAIVHAALERLYAEPPGDDSIPRPGDVGRWQRRFGELLDEVGAPATRRCAAGRAGAALERARAQVEAFLADEAESETEFRPARELLEARLRAARSRARGRAAAAPALELGEIELRGRIDRIDVAADGRSAIVRDYKTGKTVAERRQVRRDAARFRSSSTCWSRAECSASTRSAGLYQPLGAPRPGTGAPRGIADARRRAARGPRPRRHATASPREELEEMLERAEAIGGRDGRRDARRADRPRPARTASARRYCTYQPICRLERALGDVGDERRTEARSRERGPADARRPRAARARRRGRGRPPATRADARAGGRGRRPRPRRLPRGRRRDRQDARCSSTATAPRSSTTGSRSTGCWPSPSPSAPRPRCARGSARELTRRSRERPRERATPTAPTSCCALARATERAWVMTIHAFCRRLLGVPPARRRARPGVPASSTRTRPRGCATAPSARRSTTCSPPATTQVARAAAAYQPWRLAAMTIAAHERLRSQGMIRAAAARGRRARSQSAQGRATSREPLSPAEAAAAVDARAALERLLEGMHARYERAQGGALGARLRRPRAARARPAARRAPALAATWRERFDQVMVDEFQDTNRVQLELVEMLRGPETRVFMVGDENQSIYRFRNADLEVFRRERERAARRPRPRRAAAARQLPLAPGGARRRQRRRRRAARRLRPSSPRAPRARRRARRGRAAADARRGHGRATPAAGTPTSIDLDPPPSASPPKVIAEARFLAERLRELVDAGDAERGEIVVLLRAFTHVDAYEEALARAGLRPLRRRRARLLVPAAGRGPDPAARAPSPTRSTTSACSARSPRPPAASAPTRSGCCARPRAARAAAPPRLAAARVALRRAARARPDAERETGSTRIDAEDADRLERFCAILAAAARRGAAADARGPGRADDERLRLRPRPARPPRRRRADGQRAQADAARARVRGERGPRPAPASSRSPPRAPSATSARGWPRSRPRATTACG